MSDQAPHPFHFMTERLILRPMEERDRAPFAAMNLHPEVMRFFLSTYPQEKSDEHLARYQAQLERDGFSFLTVEERATGTYVGILGMQVMTTIVPGLPQPAVEIGWRFAHSGQGKGYAEEGARAVLKHAFQVLNLPEVVAIIANGNTRSRRLAEKLGMTLRPALTFDHPILPEGHPHRQHVLYAIKDNQFKEEA